MYFQTLKEQVMAMRRRRQQKKKCRITLRDVHELVEQGFCQLNRKVDRIMVLQTETAQELRQLKADNERDRAEVAEKIRALEEAIGNSGLESSQEVTDALAELKTSFEARDADVQPAPLPEDEE